MLTELQLELFKCFDRLILPLAPLTLLSGSNASGKSTVIQSIAILHQAMRHHEWSMHLPLNGAELQLGTLADVIDKVNGRQHFGIGISDDDHSCFWTFEDERRGMSAQVTALTVDGELFQPPDVLRFLLPPESPAQSLAKKIRTMTYLAAEREGPRETYPLMDEHQLGVVGSRGENSVGLLFAKQDAEVLGELVLEGAPPTLLHQVGAHMKNFFPGCSFEIRPVPQTNLLTLGLRTSDATDFHKPAHVGFGLTQVLPIVVAALSSAPSSALIVENPEVHLHPASQALMGGFLARVAAAGVQVILESHSDHVLNGIRRAVKGRAIPHEHVQFHFFSDRSSSATPVVSPAIDVEGQVSDWPDGFFDQFDKDSQYFAGWGD